MQIEHLFGGSALQAVDDRGRVQLPRFVRDVAERRSGSRSIVIGPHPADACLTAYDPAFRRALFADSERLRLRDEGAGLESPHHERMRRAFGLTEEAPYDRAGRIMLPPMMVRLGRIAALALFVGTGGAFEIWNPELAAASADPALAELARWRLGHDPNPSEQEE